MEVERDEWRRRRRVREEQETARATFRREDDYQSLLSLHHSMMSRSNSQKTDRKRTLPTSQDADPSTSKRACHEIATTTPNVVLDGIFAAMGAR